MLVIAMEVISGTGGIPALLLKTGCKFLVLCYGQWSYLISHCQLKLAWSDTTQLLISQSSVIGSLQGGLSFHLTQRVIRLAQLIQALLLFAQVT